eukprot:sb/3463139/
MCPIAGTAECVCQECSSTEYNPVCGDNCEVYFSPCLMEYENCRNDTDISIASYGFCPQVRKPDIQESYLYYSVGDSTELLCIVSRDTTPFPSAVYWTRTTTAGTRKVSTGEVLRIGSLETEDSGLYACVVEQCRNTYTSRDSVQIDVTDDITPSPTPDNLETVKKTCSVYGDPHFLTFDGYAYDFMGECHYVLAMDCLYAQWIIYGQLERCSADNVRGSCLRYKYQGSNVSQVSAGEVLRIGSLETEDSGLYACVVEQCRNTYTSRDSVQIDVTDDITPSPTPDNLETVKKTCSVYGDPHFLTFDGYAYDFMGECHYVLAMDCLYAQWIIYGQLERCSADNVRGSCLSAITIFSGRNAVELQRGWIINDQGSKMNITESETKTSGPMTITFDGRHLLVRIAGSDVEIWWDGLVSVHVSIPGGAEACGLCGNNDDNPDNDLDVGRSGVRAGSGLTSVDVADSWAVDRLDQCEKRVPVTIKRCTATSRNQAKRDKTDLSLGTKERSVYPRVRSPYPKERSVYPKVRSPYQKERSVYPKVRSPYPKFRSLIQKKGHLFEKKCHLIQKKGHLIQIKCHLILNYIFETNPTHPELAFYLIWKFGLELHGKIG